VTRKEAERRIEYAPERAEYTQKLQELKKNGPSGEL
jgi:hypothetical protein